MGRSKKQVVTDDTTPVAEVAESPTDNVDTAPATPAEETAPEEVLPTPDPPPEPYEIGVWAGYRNFGCPQCTYTVIQDRATPSGSEAVEGHIAKEHPVPWTEELESLGG